MKEHYMETRKVKPSKRGRPATLKMPEPIPDTPENVARAIMKDPPKKDWRYLKKHTKQKAS